MMRWNSLLVLLMACTVSWVATAQARAEEEAATAQTVRVFGDGDLTVPAEFKRVEPKSSIIEHEFQAKTGDGEQAETARITMMSAGGGIEDNITRWKGQFVGGDEKDQKTEQVKVGNWDVHLVDVSGSFAERMGGGPFAGGKVVNRPDYAMAGAILVNPEGRKFFVKMIGPASVVKANRKGFVDMIKSIGE